MPVPTAILVWIVKSIWLYFGYKVIIQSILHLHLSPSQTSHPRHCIILPRSIFLAYIFNSIFWCKQDFGEPFQYIFQYIFSRLSSQRTGILTQLYVRTMDFSSRLTLFFSYIFLSFFRSPPHLLINLIRSVVFLSTYCKLTGSIHWIILMHCIHLSFFLS